MAGLGLPFRSCRCYAAPVRDPYTVLGVSRGASADEIRKAFRRLAKEHHPDRHAGDEAAKKRFQEINAAYQVLNDPQHRARFDRFGVDGAAGTPGSAPGSIEDWLSEILRGGVGGAAAAASGDLSERVVLSFEEAALGCKKELSYERVDLCERCEGEGAEPGTDSGVCPTCDGHGRVRLGALGWIALGMDRQCPQCRGLGRIPTTPCSECAGKGLTVRRRSIEVSIPPGIEHGAAQTVVGAGSRVTPRSAAGDLELVIVVKAHPHFQREGDNVQSEVSISFPTAALGGDVTVETLRGKETLRIPPGTQAGDVLELRGKGIPHRFRPGAGHHLCLVRVRIPTQLSQRAKTLVSDFDTELTSSSESGVLDRLKSFFS